MRRFLLRPVLATAAVLTVAACSTLAPTPAPAPASTGGADPLTEMVCENEVRQKLVATLGVDTPQAPRATWSDPTFTCAYTYDNGSFTMTIRQLADKAAAEAYFTARQDEQPAHRSMQGLGDAAFARPDGSVYFRKDNKVMLVDVSGLPPSFGKPPIDRATVAINIVAAVLECWIET